ncbi:MAG: cytochrome c [Deltaproteobacteria bacterium]|nr:cytochrome c [Deltaproteobacteria bacterium]
MSTRLAPPAPFWLSLCTFLAGCENTGLPVSIDLERMIDQARYEPYEAAEFFADGTSMRPLAEGVVPRERILGREDYTEGTMEGKPAARFPIPTTRALLERGKDRYQVFCAPCHGHLGDGDSVVARNMTLRPPPSLLDARIRAMAPGRVFQVISKGYGLMPSYRLQLGEADRWAVIMYLRALQVSRQVSLNELPPALKEEASRALK